MRDLMNLIEDLTVPPPDAAWRAQVVAFARTADAPFTALHPDETGLVMTVYASETRAYPVLIVDSKPGVRFRPSIGSMAYRLGEPTGDPLVDRWIAQNLASLRAYSAEQIDTFTFNRQMRPAQDRLDEMPNYDRGLYNTPLAFFIRPEGLGAGHAARVKVNANYKQHFDNTDNFSIRFFPRTGVVPGHTTGQTRASDVAAMVAWLDRHRDVFIAYYNGQIGTRQFETYLSAHPFP